MYVCVYISFYGHVKLRQWLSVIVYVCCDMSLLPHIWWVSFVIRQGHGAYQVPIGHPFGAVGFYPRIG